MEVASEQVGVSADNVRVSKLNLHSSSGYVPLSPEFVGVHGYSNERVVSGRLEVDLLNF